VAAATLTKLPSKASAAVKTRTEAHGTRQIFDRVHVGCIAFRGTIRGRGGFTEGAKRATGSNLLMTTEVPAHHGISGPGPKGNKVI
jgi:hypothetical protein